MCNKTSVAKKNKILTIHNSLYFSHDIFTKRFYLNKPYIRNWLNNKNCVLSPYSLVEVCNFLQISLSVNFFSKYKMLYTLSKSKKDTLKTYKQFKKERKESINMNIDTYFG